jgi:ribosomal protein S27E
VPADGECLNCGEAALEGAYEEERVRIRCRACGETLLSVGFPPTAVRDRTPREAIGAFERWSRRQARLDRDGICAECASRVELSLEAAPGLCLGLSPVIHHHCTVCERTTYSAVGGAVLDYPEVIAFHARHDSDPREGPY